MEMREFYVKAKWGKIACVSWGHWTKPPVLMVHGYMDSAATFIPIIEHLPDSFYYVAIDFPGQGKSDGFPVGPLMNHGYLVESMKIVVDHLKWEKFTLITHSAGFLFGVYYNILCPFKITKMINFDPVVPLSTFTFQEWNPALWYQYMYNDYYENFSRWTSERNKKYTMDQALNLLVRSRGLTKEQSAVILSRTLVPLQDGMYRLSWEPCMKKLAGLPLTKDMLISIVTTNPPPMLNIVPSDDETISILKKNGIRLMEIFKKSIPIFLVFNVIGTHDVHITSPELFVREVIDFLNIDINVQSKL